jgi:hypothetical protein
VQKPEIYQRIKIYGLLSYIPVILAAGPLTGYFAGSYLEKKFGLAFFLAPVMTGIGFLSAAFETIRIIKLVIRIEQKN